VSASVTHLGCDGPSLLAAAETADSARREALAAAASRALAALSSADGQLRALLRAAPATALPPMAAFHIRRALEALDRASASAATAARIAGARTPEETYR
jgi:hypothetical protein